MSVAELARPEIRALSPYKAAQQVSNTIRLNANEAPWTNGRDRFRRPLNRYPEIRPAALGNALAEHFGCDAERLLVTRGSSEAIDLLIRTFCREGTDNIVMTSPTFSMYEHYARIQGAGINELRTRPQEDFRIDVDALLDACDSRSRLIFICSPNNPTGSVLPRPKLVEVLERRGDESVIVVDEAYVEFSGELSAVELLGEFGNLVVLRTLSKALAFAGTRCGAVMGPTDVISMLNAIQAPYAMATPVVECVEDALQAASLDEAREQVARIVAERGRVMDAVSKLAFVEKVWPSSANFFLVRVADGAAVMRAASDQGVLLRSFDRELGDCIRITVGSANENDVLLDALSSLEESPT